MASFLDSFMPAITGSLAQAGPAAIQGHLQGLEASKQLALLDAQLREAGLREKQLQQQMMLATRPQPYNVTPGHPYGSFDPLTGRIAMQGTAPFDPATQRLKEAQAKYYETTPYYRGETSLEKEAHLLGMDPQTYLLFKSQLRPTVSEILDPNDPSKVIKVDAKTGKVIGQSPRLMSLLSDQAIQDKADQYLAGDTSVMTALQPADRARLNEAITQKSHQQGVTGSERASRIAELQGVKAGLRTLGTRSATFGMAQNEALEMAPILLEASKAVPRTDFLPLNKAMLAYKRMTGDPAVTQMDAAINAWVNIYARAISPTGMPTVHDKEHAREVLERSFSEGQLEGQLQLMVKEMEAAGRAPGKVQQELRGMVPGGKAGPKAESPILKQSQIAKPKEGSPPKSALEFYDALPQSQQDRLGALYDELKAGTRSPDAFRVGVTALLGESVPLMELDAVIDQLIQKAQAKK